MKGGRWREIGTSLVSPAIRLGRDALCPVRRVGLEREMAEVRAVGPHVLLGSSSLGPC